MSSPDQPDDLDDFVYGVARGTCPRCGGSEVRHLIIGMPFVAEATDCPPEWVTWVGCVHPGHDRECKDCGWSWTDEL